MKNTTITIYTGRKMSVSLEVEFLRLARLCAGVGVMTNTTDAVQLIVTPDGCVSILDAEGERVIEKAARPGVA